MHQPDHADTIRNLIASQPEQLTERLGIRVTDIAPGRVVGTMPVAGNRQPFGLLHGGASCVLAESLGAIAAALHAGPGRGIVGVELSVSHLGSVHDGMVTGICTPLHEGGTLATYEITLIDDCHHRVCTARLTCMLKERPFHGAERQSPAFAPGD
jgi:1,4-dihydroxy-2-naphthoyl-CoA hydrolase